VNLNNPNITIMSIEFRFVGQVSMTTNNQTSPYHKQQ